MLTSSNLPRSRPPRTDLLSPLAPLSRALPATEPVFSNRNHQSPYRTSSTSPVARPALYPLSLALPTTQSTRARSLAQTSLAFHQTSLLRNGCTSLEHTPESSVAHPLPCTESTPSASYFPSRRERGRRRRSLLRSSHSQSHPSVSPVKRFLRFRRNVMATGVITFSCKRAAIALSHVQHTRRHPDS